MSVNTAESENAQPVAHKPASELIYRLEDRPPLPQTLFAAFQHLLAMFVAVITPALLICGLSVSRRKIPNISSACRCSPPASPLLFRSKHGPGRLGLLSIRGTSFNFVAR